MLGLRRLGLDGVWLELLPATNNPREDEARVLNFQRRLGEHGLQGRYCLLYQTPARDVHELTEMECIGMSQRELRDRLAGPNTLLNLSYSFHPPFLMDFEHRIFCDLDPSEIFFWMTRMEMGQSYHHEFWTIGLNVHGADCKLPPSPLAWRTFYPLADTQLLRLQPRPKGRPKFSTIGQWYWGGGVEVDGEFPDLSKKFAFEPYLDLPRLVPEVDFELAMNINANDPEIARLRSRGWKIVPPHEVARTPGSYRRYLAGTTGEFTAIKGVDVAWRTGWVSDRAAAFLALGRPVITEETGATNYLPQETALFSVQGVDQAVLAVRQILENWASLSEQARHCAVEIFDSAGNLRKILDLTE